MAAPRPLKRRRLFFNTRGSWLLGIFSGPWRRPRAKKYLCPSQHLHRNATCLPLDFTIALAAASWLSS